MNVSFGGYFLIDEAVGKLAATPKEGYDKTTEALEVAGQVAKKFKDACPDSFKVFYTGPVDYKPIAADYEVFQPFMEIPVGDGTHGDAGFETVEDYAHLMVARQVERDTRNGDMYFRRRVGEDLTQFFNRIIDKAAEEYQKMRASFGLN